jgi:hypothetical protein
MERSDGAVNSSRQITHHPPFCVVSNSERRDFSFGIIELLLGPQQKPRFAHKVILTKIPFFERMLKENRWPESSSKFGQVKLPEDDPAVFDHILAYAYQGKVVLRALNATGGEEAPENSNPGTGTLPDANQAEQMQAFRSQEMMSLVNLYVMADKFNMEQCLNDIVDQYQSYLWYQGVDRASFLQVVRCCPETCDLRGMIIAQIAYESRLEGYDTYKHKMPELFSAFIEADVESALEYAKAVCSLSDNKGKQKIGKWHRHV